MSAVLSVDGSYLDRCPKRGCHMSEVLSVGRSMDDGLKRRPMSEVLSVDRSMGEALSVGRPIQALSP